MWTENPQSVFCKSHKTAVAPARAAPTSDEFVAHCQRLGNARIDFRGLAPQLKLELQYAVQCRHDRPHDLADRSQSLDRPHANAAVTSLLDLSAEQWRGVAGERRRTGGNYGRPTVPDLRARRVETLRDGTGWDVEYPRDIWRLHRLPGLTLTPGKTHARTPICGSTGSPSRG